MNSASRLLLDNLYGTLDFAYQDVARHARDDAASIEVFRTLDEINDLLGDVLRSPTSYGTSLEDALGAVERRLARVMSEYDFASKARNDEPQSSAARLSERLEEPV